MGLRRTLAVTRRLLLAVLREPGELALVFGAPLLTTLAAGLVLVGRFPERARWVFLDQFLPATLGLAVFVVSVLTAFLAMGREKRDGTLDRLLTTPLRPLELVGGTVLYHGALSLVPAALMTILILRVAGLSTGGRVILLFLAVALLALCGAGLGHLLSCAFRTQAAAIRVLPVTLLGALLLSGGPWPLMAMPAWVRPLARLTPVLHSVEACRSVIAGGLGLPWVWPDLAWLAGIGAAVWIGGALLLRRGQA